MTNDLTHPAASHEFLSRLHDGELSPAEAAGFLSHREACAECDEAVDTFERTLAAYRAAPTGTPSSDLSARILKKIRAQSPSRRPFGVTFGIDIRWAGAMIAAMLVLLVAAPLLLRKDAATPSAPIPVLLESRAEPEPPASASDEKAREPEAPAVSPPIRQALESPSAQKEEARTETADRLADAPSVAPKAAAQEADASPARRGAMAVQAKEDRREVAPTASADAPVLHLSILALDGQGQPPELVRRIPEDRLAAARGREFELVVGQDGRVEEAAPHLPTASTLEMRRQNASDSDAQALRGLRFAPGDIPRRLLVRIE